MARFTLAAAAAGYAVLQVFESFISPLAWAVITGAALYKLKTLAVQVLSHTIPHHCTHCTVYMIIIWHECARVVHLI